MEYQVLFFTHTGAIKFSREMKTNNIECILMPVPRSMSSNCSVSAKIIYDGKIEDLINQDVEKVFSLESEPARLIYED
ncbi:MAG: DUF3343 domain-containing protein [Clostridia bacterium]